MERDYLEKLLLKSVDKNTPDDIKADKVFDYNNEKGFECIIIFNNAF